MEAISLRTHPLMRSIEAPDLRCEGMGFLVTGQTEETKGWGFFQGFEVTWEERVPGERGTWGSCRHLRRARTREERRVEMRKRERGQFRTCMKRILNLQWRGTKQIFFVVGPCILMWGKHGWCSLIFVVLEGRSGSWPRSANSTAPRVLSITFAVSRLLFCFLTCIRHGATK